MSTIKVNKIENTSTTDGGVSIDNDGHVTIDGQQLPTAGPLSNRNIVINGAMRVAQRGTSATELGEGNSNTYLVDRFSFMESGTPTYQFTYSQDTDVPAGQGFSNSLKLLCTTADTSLTSNERLRIRQAFEGQDLQRIKKGTANAETLSLSFWIKSNLTGDVTVALEDNTNLRIISENATINAADTWEYKTIQFAGDTSGALNNDNAVSIMLEWYFKAGSNYTSGTQQSGSWGTRTVTANFASPNNIDLGAAVNNYVNITGVQLEVGSKSTPFEHKSYGDELHRCSRYYEKVRVRGTLLNTNSSSGSSCPLIVQCSPKRATPSITDLTSLSVAKYIGDAAENMNISSVSYNADNHGLTVNMARKGASASQDLWFLNTGSMEFNAEL